MSDASSQQPVPRSKGSSLHPAFGSESRGSSHGSAASNPISSDGQTVISTRPPVPDLPYVGGVPGEAARIWEGEQLGQFTLQKFVGGGGMGIVFRAHDITLDREVAVKVLSRDQSADEETLRRFRNEAQSAARLNHDNIARVFYVGEDRGVHYIVFEFIEGVNIRDLIDREGPLPLNQALSYTYQIALALDHASQRSVIHRDIKPSNVLVTSAGKAKLVDMGLARLNLMAHASNDLTASGVTLGTFDYISPEQARDPRSADVRSDLYSLGCSFYFMLTGRPPFPEGTVLQKLLQHQGDAPPDPRSLRPELPSQVSRVLGRLLAKNPAERYQQPLELIEELVPLGQMLGIALGEAPPPRSALQPQRSVRPWQRHLPWAVPLAALLVVVAALEFSGSQASLPPEPLWSVRPAEPSISPRVEQVTPTIEASDGERSEALLPPAMPGSSSRPQSQDSSPVSPRRASRPMNEAFPPAARPPGDDAGPATTSGVGPVAPAPNAPFLDGLLDLVSRMQKEVEAAQQRRSVSNTSDELDLAGTASDPQRMPNLPFPGQREILTVGDDSLPNNYTSLLAACSAAKDGDIIELHYNGSRTERPLALSNIRLTIRSGSGYRPTVVFAPEPDRPFAGAQMVGVSGGQLYVRNVHWELELPANSPTERALFEAQHAELLDFENCSFTVRSQPPYYGGVTIFEIKSPPGAGTMDIRSGSAAAASQVVNIHLENCVARGEATLLRDSEMQAVRFTWNDGLLAIGDRLLVTEGTSLEPRQEMRVEVVLRHVTAMVGSGLVLMTNSEEEPYQVVVDMRASDCIIATRGSAPLIEQRGSAGIEEFLARFQWSADSVYFQGFNTFWQVMNSAGPGGSKRLTFDDWHEWSRFTSRRQFAGSGAVVWSAPPPAARPYHAHLASDYVLSSTSAAVGGASDGADAGAPLPYLPTLAVTSGRSDSTRSEPTLPASRPMSTPMPMPAEPMRMPPEPMGVPNTGGD